MCATTVSLLFNFCFFLFLDPTVGATPFHGGGYPLSNLGATPSHGGAYPRYGVNPIAMGSVCFGSAP